MPAHYELAARLLMQLGYEGYRPGYVPNVQELEARNRAAVQVR